jgi:hypothetical protein
LLPQEDDHLRCLATASLLLQQSVTAWRAQQHDQHSSSDGSQALIGLASASGSFKGHAGFSSSASAAAAATDDTTAAATGRRALLQSLEQEMEGSQATQETDTAADESVSSAAAASDLPPNQQGAAVGAGSRDEPTQAGKAAKAAKLAAAKAAAAKRAAAKAAAPADAATGAIPAVVTAATPKKERGAVAGARALRAAVEAEAAALANKEKQQQEQARKLQQRQQERLELQQRVARLEQQQKQQVQQPEQQQLGTPAAAAPAGGKMTIAQLQRQLQLITQDIKQYNQTGVTAAVTAMRGGPTPASAADGGQMGAAAALGGRSKAAVRRTPDAAASLQQQQAAADADISVLPPLLQVLLGEQLLQGASSSSSSGFDSSSSSSNSSLAAVQELLNAAVQWWEEDSVDAAAAAAEDEYEETDPLEAWECEDMEEFGDLEDVEAAAVSDGESNAVMTDADIADDDEGAAAAAAAGAGAGWTGIGDSSSEGQEQQDSNAAAAAPQASSEAAVWPDTLPDEFPCVASSDNSSSSSNSNLSSSSSSPAADLAAATAEEGSSSSQQQQQQQQRDWWDVLGLPEWWSEGELTPFGSSSSSSSDAALLQQYNQAVANLQIPAHLSLSTAMQYGVTHLDGTAAAAGGDDGEQPFAWMYLPQLSRRHSSSSSSSETGHHTVAWVLQQLQAADPWQYSYSPGGSTQTADSTMDLLQWLQQRGKQYKQQMQRVQQEQLMLLNPKLKNPEQAAQVEAGAAAAAAAVTDGLASAAAFFTEAAAAALNIGVDKQQQQQQSQDAAADLYSVVHPDTADTSSSSSTSAAAAAAAVDSLDIPYVPGQLLEPVPHPRFSHQELTVIFNVMKMARGTSLEAALWSEVTLQRTLLQDGALQQQQVMQRDSSSLLRLGLSKPPGLQRVQRQKQRQAAEQQKQQQQQQQQLEQPSGAVSSSSNRQYMQSIEWLSPLLAAALATRAARAGLSNLFDVKEQQQQQQQQQSRALLQKQLAAAIDNQWHHMQPWEKLLLHQVQQQRKLEQQQQNEQLQPAAALQPAQLLRQQQQLEQWSQQQRQLQPQQPPGAAAAGGPYLTRSLIALIGQQRDAQSLLHIMSDFRHYFAEHPELAAALVRQAGRVWSTPAAIRLKGKQGGADAAQPLIAVAAVADSVVAESAAGEPVFAVSAAGEPAIAESANAVSSTAIAESAAVPGVSLSSLLELTQRQLQEAAAAQAKTAAPDTAAAAVEAAQVQPTAAAGAEAAAAQGQIAAPNTTAAAREAVAAAEQAGLGHMVSAAADTASAAAAAKERVKAAAAVSAEHMVSAAPETVEAAAAAAAEQAGQPVAAAAAASSSDSSSLLEPVSTQETPAVAAAAAAAAADVAEGPQSLAAVLASSSSSSSSVSRGAAAAVELAASQHLFKQLVELLTAAKPQTLDLTSVWRKHNADAASLLLQQQQQQSAGLAASNSSSSSLMLDVFTWAVALPDVVAAAPASLYQLMMMLQTPKVLSQLPPAELLQLYSCLMDWQQFGHWGQQQQFSAAQLYAAVVAELASKQPSALAGQEQQLLQLVQHACVACAALVPPGGWPSSDHKSRRLLNPSSTNLKRDDIPAVHHTLLKAWQQSAAAAPALGAAAQTAAARGQLQQISGNLLLMLQHVDAVSLTQLLHVLAAMRPCYAFDSFDHAHAATEHTMGCDAKGMWQGSIALQNLSCGIASHLITSQPQQQRKKKDQQQQQQQQQHWWDWWKQQQADELQQQQQQRGVLPDVPLLQLPASAVLGVLSDLTAVSQGCDRQSKQGRAFADVANYILDAQAPVQSSATQQQQQQQQQELEPLLYRWHVPELLHLMDMLFDKDGPAFETASQSVNTKLAAATAHQVQLLASWISSSSSSSGLGSSSSGVIGRRRRVKLNLNNLRASLTGQSPTRDSQSSSEVSSEVPDSQASLEKLLSGSPEKLQDHLAAAADYTFVLTRHRQYHPDLLNAVGELLVALQDAGSSSSSTRQQQLLQPDKLSKLVTSLAMFNHCSLQAAVAVQRLTAAALPSTLCSVVTTTRLAWGLSVLSQRDGTLWGSMQRALQHGLDREWRVRLHRLSGGAAHRAAEQPRRDIWGKVRRAGGFEMSWWLPK